MSTSKTTQEIPAGKKGTLTAKDLSSAPMPHWAPMYPPPGKGTFTNEENPDWIRHLEAEGKVK